MSATRAWFIAECALGHAVDCFAVAWGRTQACFRFPFLAGVDEPKTLFINCLMR